MSDLATVEPEWRAASSPPRAHAPRSAGSSRARAKYLGLSGRAHDVRPLFVATDPALVRGGLRPAEERRGLRRQASSPPSAGCPSPQRVGRAELEELARC